MTEKVNPVIDQTGQAILDELNNRKGFRHLLDEIEGSDDGELMAEIRAAVAKAAAKVLLSMEPTPDMQQSAECVWDGRKQARFAVVYRAMTSRARADLGIEG